MRAIMHDWPAAYCKTILKHLSAAAEENKTQLVIFDSVIPFAAPTNAAFAHIKGADVPPAPQPLQANLGAVNYFPSMIDLQVREKLPN